VFRAHSGRLAAAAARSARPDVIILDETLPGEDIYVLCRELRDDPEVGPSVPILLATKRKPDAADHLAALRGGVWEFLVDPPIEEELIARLQAYFVARAETRRDSSPLVDVATGLASLRGLTLRARELTLQAFNHYAPIACVAIAPEPGSTPEAVALVAETLRASARKSDAIGAIELTRGEFLVVAPGTDGAGAVKLAERFARAVQATAARKSRPSPALRAGYDVVENVRYAPVEPRDLFGHATTALHSSGMSWIKKYEMRP